MMKLPEKKQLVIIGAVGVIVLGFAILRFYPLSKESLQLKRVQSELKIASGQVDQYGTLVPVLRQRASELQQKTAMFDVKVPENRRFAGLWEQIADVMNKHHLNDQIVQPGNEIKGERVNCIPITIQCSGTLSQIFDMLNSLDDFERTIRVEKIELVNGSDFGGQVRLNADANVYYQESVTESI